MKLGDAVMIATATGRSYSTVRSWIHRGKLHPVDFDERGRVLYNLDQATRLAAEIDARRNPVQHSDRSRTTAP
jgi:predicted site-specific integrase-resolvase